MPSASANQPPGTGNFEYEAGDLFPIGAVMAARAVTSTYSAHDAVHVLQLPVQEVQALAALSPPFAEFMQGRVRKQMELGVDIVDDGELSKRGFAVYAHQRLGGLTATGKARVSPWASN